MKMTCQNLLGTFIELESTLSLGNCPKHNINKIENGHQQVLHNLVYYKCIL